jgi:RNA polymerase sigma-70 factor, ECF subfamily
MAHVPSQAVAEEVVQDTWVGVLNGIDRFEGRSSLKTWILSILVNKAKTRGLREARIVPFAALAREGDEPSVPAERFRAGSDAFPGHWRAYPGNWQESAATIVQDRETLRVVMGAIAELPLAQQTVIRMRDVEGYSSDEVCAALDVSEGNQRVLLHRARSRVRSALERHLDG